MVDFHNEIEENILIVHIAGKIFEKEAADFKDHIIGSLDNPLIKKVLLNLQKVTQVDSSGIGGFIGIYKALREKQIQLCLCRPAPHVATLFEDIRLTTVIPIYETQISALEHMKTA